MIPRTACRRHRGHEAIAPSCEGRDVSGAILSIAQHLAEARHMKPQAAFFDSNVGPYLGHQIFLAKDLLWRGNQGDQNIESASAQFYGSALFGEEPFAGDQSEGA